MRRARRAFTQTKHPPIQNHVTLRALRSLTFTLLPQQAVAFYADPGNGFIFQQLRWRDGRVDALDGGPDAQGVHTQSVLGGAGELDGDVSASDES